MVDWTGIHRNPESSGPTVDDQEFVTSWKKQRTFRSRQNGNNARWHSYYVIGLFVNRFVRVLFSSQELCLFPFSSSGNGEKNEEN